MIGGPLVTDLSPFHLAIPVKDLDETLAFYEELLQCSRGRESSDWVDLNFLGHQLVLHRVERAARDETDTNPVDGEHVPVPHFGVVLDWGVFESLTERLAAQKCDFVLPPTTRFEGRVGEQRTCFLKDPSGNCLEFKAFRQPDRLFATDRDAYQ